MAIRQIRTEDDEILKKKSKPIEVVDDKLVSLVDDMIETLYKYDGIGLAAVQVGFLKQLFIVDNIENTKKGEHNIYVFINPKILWQKGEQIVEEGCLSFPNRFAKISRPEKLMIEYLDYKTRKNCSDKSKRPFCTSDFPRIRSFEWYYLLRKDITRHFAIFKKAIVKFPILKWR
jgi:peptide deformylase